MHANKAIEPTPVGASELGEIPAVPFLLPASPDEWPSVEDELYEWKRTRGTKIPWTQLSLMASLCFGIGSFVLPDSVNSGVQWLLWGLAATSAYVWFTNRRAKARVAAEN
ncbi:MAG TPA: hypothetical protein VGG69_05130 [Rhizomicrobium sp.]|jgi:hypothetical protein